MVLWANQSPKPKWHLSRFSGLCTAQNCNRPTYHATQSVTIGCIYVHSTAMRHDDDGQSGHGLMMSLEGKDRSVIIITGNWVSDLNKLLQLCLQFKHQSIEINVQNKHEKLNPGLVALY